MTICYPLDGPVGVRAIRLRPGHVQATLIQSSAALVNAGIPTATGTAPAPSVFIPAPPIPLTQPAGARVIGIRAGHVQFLPSGPRSFSQDPAPGPLFSPLTGPPGIRVSRGRPGHVQATKITPSSFLNVSAGPVAATGVSPQPLISESVLAGAPAGTGAAPAPGKTIQVLAAVPAASAASPSPLVPPQSILDMTVLVGATAYRALVSAAGSVQDDGKEAGLLQGDGTAAGSVQDDGKEAGPTIVDRRG